MCTVVIESINLITSPCADALARYTVEREREQRYTYHSSHFTPHTSPLTPHPQPTIRGLVYGGQGDVRTSLPVPREEFPTYPNHGTCVCPGGAKIIRGAFGRARNLHLALDSWKINTLYICACIFAPLNSGNSGNSAHTPIGAASPSIFPPRQIV